MKILKKTLQIVFLVFLAIIFVASILVIISSAAQKNKGYSGAFGYTFESVQSPSMSGPNGFEEGDMIVGKVIDANTVIEVGDVISFKAYESGKWIIKSHRITREWEEGSFGIVYETWGDNREACPVADSGYVTRSDITSIYLFKIKGLGKVIDAMKSPLGYLALAIPIGIYVLYEIFVFISIFMSNKKKQMLQETQDAKEAIIREYLAAQNSANTVNTDETTVSESVEESIQQTRNE